jgi:hypothetical protein
MGTRTLSDVNRRTGKSAWLRKDAAASYERMKAAGMPGGCVNDAGRTRAEQQALYDAWLRTGKKNPPSVARPGTSLHESGIAIDLAEPARAWIRKHGARFGWVNPEWAKRSATYEPWHWEYDPARDKSLEDDMPITRADADLIVDRFLARRIEHTAGQKAASNRDSATIERILGDTSAGGFRAWKDLPALRAELAATRAALVALAKNTSAVDPKKVERIIESAVQEALSDISITLTTGD